MSLPRFPAALLDHCRRSGVVFVDLWFSTLFDTLQHYTVSIDALDAHALEATVRVAAAGTPGVPFALRPDLSTGAIDPFLQHPALRLIASMSDDAGEPRNHDARAALQRAIKAAAAAGVSPLMGGELQFRVFDQVCASESPNGGRWSVDARDAYWRLGREDADNLGTQVRPDEGAFAAPPFDLLHNLRGEMAAALAQFGAPILSHARGPGSAGHGTLQFGATDPLTLADALQTARYVARNVAARHGKVASFMPQPIVGDVGTGFPIELVFSVPGASTRRRGGESDPAPPLVLKAVGGILRNAAALMTLTNPTTNSYKRLAGFTDDDPFLTLGRRKLPDGHDAWSVTLFAPDAAANPYLALAALLAAAADGAQGDAETEVEVAPAIGGAAILYPDVHAPTTLATALAALHDGHAFLTEPGVFAAEALDVWIEHKRDREVLPMLVRPHPHEFELYFHV